MAHLYSSVPLAAVLILSLSGCSSPAPERRTINYSAGDKAQVEKLTYSVVDTQIFPRLGEDGSPRIPQNRFYVVQLSVSNAASAEAVIPGMTLIDDSGKTYEELPDGTGVPRWLGVTRRVAGNQSEQGAVLFDAPTAHYKLKITDDTDAADVFIDIPLSFAHEQMQNETQLPPDTTGAAAPPPAAKKP